MDGPLFCRCSVVQWVHKDCELGGHTGGPRDLLLLITRVSCWKRDLKRVGGMVTRHGTLNLLSKLYLETRDRSVKYGCPGYAGG